MNKKAIGVIFAVIILVIPIQSVFAKAQQSELKNEDALKSGSNSSIIDMINMANESMIWTYLVGLVDIGPRYTGSGNCISASHYVYNEFEKLGLDVYIDQWFFPRYSCRNVVATLNGSDSSSDAVIVVCAHYDTISYPKPYDRSPGANDDGAGVAAMLAIANICSKYTFAHTIRFVTLSREEEG